jgi:hypothetical protein
VSLRRCPFTPDPDLAIGLVLLAINASLKYVGLGVLAVTLVIAFLRWQGKWFTQWAGLTAK